MTTASKDLSATVDLFERMAENLPGFLYALRGLPAGRYCCPYASGGIHALLDLQPSEVVDDIAPLRQRVHAQDREGFDAAIAGSAQTLAPFTVEFRLARPCAQTGLQRWVQACGKPEREADGGILWHGAMLDISDSKRAQAALAERDAEFRTLSDNAPGNIIRYDTRGRILYLNAQLEKSLGVPAAQIIGKLSTEVFPDGRYAAYEHLLLEVAASGRGGKIEVPALSDDGTLGTHAVQVVAERDAQGQIVGLLSMGHDITPLKRSQQQLTVSQGRLRAMLSTHPDLIWMKDAQGVYLLCNHEFESLIGRPEAEIVGKTDHDLFEVSLADFFRAKDLAAIAAGSVSVNEEEVTFAVDGRRCWLETRKAPVFDEQGRVTGVLGIARDVTELKAQRRQIEELAYTDAVTGLSNRVVLRQRLRQWLDSGHEFALMLLDVDHFKDVNDSLGHSHGDRLLKEIGWRLSAALRPGDLLVRLGGDEFVVLMDLADRVDVARAAERLVATMRQPFEVNGQEWVGSCSMGIALCPRDSGQVDELIAFADSAMYAAKRGGRDRCLFYSSEFTQRASEKLALGQALRHALAREELVLYYQPKHALDGERLLGAEALLRWRHPQLGLLAPDKFIPLAEDSGEIVPIGRWVIEEACRCAVRWNRRHDTALKIAVNISPRQFGAGDLSVTVAAALAASGCEPAWLEIEITEGLLINDDEAVQQALARISALGVTVAIDDFGTGHSALGYLHRFHVDVLKIDRSFVRDMERDARKAALVNAFISMADTLDMQTVAEGVETAEQARMLQAQGCALGQGYFYGRPVPEVDFALRFWRREHSA